MLGIAYGTADWLNLAAFGLYFCRATTLRREHRLQLLLCRGGALVADSWRVVREVVVEGLQLMVVDVCVQLSLTCTIYLAAYQNFETAYTENLRPLPSPQPIRPPPDFFLPGSSPGFSCCPLGRSPPRVFFLSSSSCNSASSCLALALCAESLAAVSARSPASSSCNACTRDDSRACEEP